MLSAGSHAPSRSAAGQEAVRTIQNVISQLPEDFRQAVQLPLLEGRSREEVALAMDRSSRAVQWLVDRVKAKTSAALGRLSLYQEVPA